MNQSYMLKILTVLGARPQFIKAAAVSRAIADYPEIQEVIIHSGQHYDYNMSDIFFKEMQIPTPDYFLNLKGATHASMVSEILLKTEEIVLKENPNLVMVYGDTNTTLAAALATAKLNIPIMHIEAGVRSFDKSIPEEINRVLTDHMSSLLFCPTIAAQENLKAEGITKNVYLVGDVMYDAFLYYDQYKKAPQSFINMEQEGEFALCTIHRQENTNNLDNLNSILSALREISLHTKVILPLHPRTKKFIEANNINTKGINICEPVSYFEMLYLLERCKLVLTDSGGLQKEAYFYNKPALIFMEQTPWIELAENGVGFLVGANKERIVSTFHKIIDAAISFPSGLYGDGKASHKIISKFKDFFNVCGLVGSPYKTHKAA